MEKFEYKVVTYDTGGFAGGKVDALRMEEQLNLIGDGQLYIHKHERRCKQKHSVYF